MDLIQTPEVQRLRRIRQLGVGHLVFPGAEHTRFNHALGAMALMHDALTSLSNKGTPIAPEEHTAALAAALLHDVGHGAFSHTLEHELIRDFHHEDMSRVLLVHLNERFDGALEPAIAIFDGTYERPWMHQLVSSQLDMDRLDYLRRDAFYTGVAEGEVGVQRIIKTLRVHPQAGGADARITVESKGIYAVENFLISRRLMYWQVYLHKTVLAGDRVLHAALQRARRHLRAGSAVADTIRQGSRSLCFFLEHDIGADALATEPVRSHYCQLDDTDVLFSLKQWMQADDPVLADLSRRFINRDFFRVTFLGDAPDAATQEAWAATVRRWLLRAELATPDTVNDDLPYYLHTDRSRHAAYATGHDPIAILDRSGALRELSQMADTAAIADLDDTVVKPYVSYPKSAGVTINEPATNEEASSES